MPFTNRLFTTGKTPPIESPGSDKLGSAVFLCTSAPKLITRARTHAHKRRRQPSDMHAGAHTHTQILLWAVTDWVNAAINGPVYNVSIQNGGLRVEQVLSQSVGRGKRCNSLLSLLDHWESSASFLHNLCPLWPQRNWGTLPFHIYPFLYKPPQGLFPGLPPLLPSIEKALPHLFPGPLFNSGQLCNNVFNIYRHQPRRYAVRLVHCHPPCKVRLKKLQEHLNISLAIWTTSVWPPHVCYSFL